MPNQPTADDRERADLLETLGMHRHFLRYTVRDLTDEQARARTTASTLCLGGVIKHVSWTESRWANFITDGPDAMGDVSPEGIAAHEASFQMTETDSLPALLDRYQQVAERTDELVRSLPSLDASQPLPKAPWHAPGTRRTARWVFLHVIAETAQHAGHADIIRESLDGGKTMG